jgi:hypothetical protein
MPWEILHFFANLVEVIVALAGILSLALLITMAALWILPKILGVTEEPPEDSGLGGIVIADQECRANGTDSCANWSLRIERVQSSKLRCAQQLDVGNSGLCADRKLAVREGRRTSFTSIERLD